MTFRSFCSKENQMSFFKCVAYDVPEIHETHSKEDKAYGEP
jgi:hypothetical protein